MQVAKSTSRIQLILEAQFFSILRLLNREMELLGLSDRHNWQTHRRVSVAIYESTERGAGTNVCQTQLSGVASLKLHGDVHDK